MSIKLERKIIKLESDLKAAIRAHENCAKECEKCKEDCKECEDSKDEMAKLKSQMKKLSEEKTVLEGEILKLKKLAPKPRKKTTKRS